MIESVFVTLTRLLTGCTVRDRNGDLTSSNTRVYFCNHNSHLDFLLVWSVFPKRLRRNIRPVAARDYWAKGIVRKHLITNVFNAVLIERKAVTAKNNPIRDLSAALNDGNSLIIFPEGGRSMDGEIKKFKSGIYHLARKNPETEFVPVYIENLNRILPKGTVLPVPLLCSVTFGEPLRIKTDESKENFLERAQKTLEDLEC